MTNDNRQPSAVDELSERFWEAILELNPVTATVYGDERYADRLDDPGPEGRAATRRLMERTLAEVDAIPVDGLPTEDRITRDMLRVVAELGIEEDDQRIYQLRVVDQMSGPQQTLPQLTSFQTADTPARLDAFLARIHAYRDYMAANADILREGVASGLTAPRIVAERTIAQIERMLEEAGLVRRRQGRLEVTPRGARKLGERALTRIFEALQRDREGSHEARDPGGLAEPTGATRPWEFGDHGQLAVQRTVFNAVTHTRPGEPIRLRHRQRSKRETIDDRKDRRIRADAQRE